MDIYGADRVAVKSYLCFTATKALAVLWFLIKWKIESAILTNFKANLNAMKQIKLSQMDTIVGKSSQLIFTYAPVEREFCLPQTEIQTKCTYSGIVLAAEATLSLDSFFFIALEAIFAWISRIFKRQKLICVNESKALLSRQPMRLDPVLHGLVSWIACFTKTW